MRRKDDLIDEKKTVWVREARERDSWSLGCKGLHSELD